MRPHPATVMLHIRWRLKLVLAISCLQLIAVAAAAGQDLSERLQQAVQDRDRHGATSQEQAHAFAMLLEAAGVKGSSGGSNGAEAQEPMQILQSISKEIPAPVLRDLGNSFMLGAGVNADQQAATQLYQMAADKGDPEALGHMGLRLAYGLQDPAAAQGNTIRYFGQADEGAAILRYTLAAAAGDKFSQAVLGYRHLHGLGVPKSCWTAVTYYQPVAEAVIEAALAAGGLRQIEPLRLNLHANQGLRSERQREVLQYYQYSADRGNVDAQTTVGAVLIAGTHGLSDHVAAYHYLQRAAAAGDGEAMAHLGSMYAAGVGVPQSWKQALSWFQRSADKQNTLAYYSLGYMHLSGQGVLQDYDRALKYFTKGAEGGDRDSHFYLGVMHMQGLGVKRRSVNRAFIHFFTAAQAGHSQAMYNAAMLQLAGRGAPRSCRPAAMLLKQLSEKGLVAVSLQQGHERFFTGQYAQALLFYLRAAEMGMELGQSNAAWMLDRGYGHAGPHAAAVATQLYRRSAEQGNVVSLLQLGDNYYHGNGIEQDWTRAAAIYYEAYRERSAEAMFNLGFMHEFGAGVPQDLALAQRFYDMCKHTMPDAALPVALAKSWLGLHRAWVWLVPRLPKQLQDSAKQVFVLKPANVRAGGGLEGLLDGIMPRSLALHWESLGWRLGELMKTLMLSIPADFMTQDMGDTVLLGGLLVVLWVVLKVRRQRQMAAVGPRVAPAGADQRPAAAAAAALQRGWVAGGGVRPEGVPAAGGTGREGAAAAAAAGAGQAGVLPGLHGQSAHRQPQQQQQQQEVQQGVRPGAVAVQREAEQRPGDPGAQVHEVLSAEEEQLTQQYQRREQERRQQLQGEESGPGPGTSQQHTTREGACSSGGAGSSRAGVEGAGQAATAQEEARRAAAAAAEKRAQQLQAAAQPEGGAQ